MTPPHVKFYNKFGHTCYLDKRHKHARIKEWDRPMFLWSKEKPDGYMTLIMAEASAEKAAEKLESIYHYSPIITSRLTPKNQTRDAGTPS
jgi:hypothetical protein